MALLDALLSWWQGEPGSSTPTTDAVCECCRRLDGDTSEKPVMFCSLCGAYLCDDCRGNYLRRARAALT